MAMRQNNYSMPTLLTPPNPAPPQPPLDKSAVKVRTGRFGELEEHELIHLLDTLDDERERARFRESIYISLLVWTAFVLFLIFAPKYLFHQVEIVNPALEKSRELTNLNAPEISKPLPKVPKVVPKAQLDRKTMEALRRQETAPPAPATPPPAPAPVQQAQQQPVPLPPSPHPAPQQNAASLPAAPTPSPVQPRQPSPATPTPSAADLLREAAQAPRANGSRGLSDGSNSGGGAEHRGVGTGVDVLSDMEGVDFDPYLKKIIAEIRSTWLPLIPEEARPPLNKQGETEIRFIILPDGRIGGMVLEDSTHDDAINKSCWGSITGVGQFPPLPSQFHGPKLELRIHYFVNKQPQ
jgi:outer membrane biosynthesis protein TonB